MLAVTYTSGINPDVVAEVGAARLVARLHGVVDIDGIDLRRRAHVEQASAAAAAGVSDRGAAAVAHGAGHHPEQRV